MWVSLRGLKLPSTKEFNKPLKHVFAKLNLPSEAGSDQAFAKLHAILTVSIPVSLNLATMAGDHPGLRPSIKAQ